MKHRAIIVRGLLTAITLLTLLAGFGVKTVWAAAAFFQTYIILNIKSAGNTYYDAGATTGNPDFLGANLGTFTTSDTLLLNGGEAKTYKNTGSNITAVYMDYCVYPSSGSCSGGFTSVQLPWDSDLDSCGDGACDQKWDKTDAGINILQGLTPGDYTLAVYFHADTNNVDCPNPFYDNRGGANYTASFTLNNPTAIVLSSFGATPQSEGIRITWETAMELQNLGFNLYRGESFTGPWVKLNAALIPAQNPGATFGASYEWLDTAVTPEVTYFYRLEDVSVGGASTFHGPVSATAAGVTAVRIAHFGAQGSAPAVLLLALTTAAAGCWTLRRRRG